MTIASRHGSHGPSELIRLQREVDRLTKENRELRDALSPFACLGRNELRTGDFNRARRALKTEDLT